MSKPEDISQDVWDAAWPVAARCFESFGPDSAEAIARAIIAAKAEEREACAVICDNQAAENMDIAQRSLSLGSREEYVAKTQAASRSAFAIRKREDA